MDEFANGFAKKYLESLEKQNDLIAYMMDGRNAATIIMAIQSAHIVQLKKCYAALSSSLPGDSRPTFSDYLRSLAHEHEKEPVAS